MLTRKAADQWFDLVPKGFSENEIATTTILFGGLTIAHDFFLEGALRGLGYRVQRLDCPDAESLRFGKEFGNRGQCNPAYFTVGNLIKYLHHLHHVEGVTKDEIIRRYVLLTIDSCGPCRFGTYATEYRKALRDAGFGDFRVILLHQQQRFQQVAGERAAFSWTPPFVMTVLKAVFLGDILNAIGYRIRPYEIESGSTETALNQCKQILYESFSKRRWLIPAVRRCRKILSSVVVDRTLIKPKVSIIGEFWAMTTEGDGNYRLPRFLEDEGAEVAVQPITSWIIGPIWTGRYDIRERISLYHPDTGRKGLKGKFPILRLQSLWAADRVIRVMFQIYAKVMGLYRYHLPDMDEIARVAHPFYNNHLRGGEGHMEVGKHILNVRHREANMTLSVKPFGCMPSSGVSDGVQSLVTELYPEAIFLSVETTGDGAVNAYSRVQMMLFKAKQNAQKEFDQALNDTDITVKQFKHFCDNAGNSHALKYPRHVAACTAANMVYGVARSHIIAYKGPGQPTTST